MHQDKRSDHVRQAYREVTWAEVERQWPLQALSLAKGYGYDLSGFRFVHSPDGWLFVQSVRVSP